ncbi:MAG: DUF4298 domain-containing protein [Clostridia bacterium]|nr:DUF4298 domain-containing protein [Clostridia bacterium]MBR6918380.1 DUF4298 domain-containing protein [Clostridia bacterium]
MRETARIKRIKENEERFEKLSLVVGNCKKAADELRGAEEIAKELDAYLTGGRWIKDYEADDAGLIPKDIKRGVLSQDALYDLLAEYDSLREKLT